MRRRIDANRAASKPAPSPAAREPYPIPAAAPTPPARRPEPQPSPATPAPAEVAPPAPAVPQVQQPSPLPPMDAEMAADEARAGDAYTGLYPELPGHTAPPPSAPPRPYDDGLVAEARTADPPRTASASYAPAPPAAPSRRPPPLPAGPPPAPVIAEPPPSPLRPRRLGAPDVPPSSIPWPAPVVPQPSALPPPPPIPYPPNAAAPPRSEPDFDPLDGGIAGAPYPEPDSVPARPVEPLPVPSPARRPPVAKSTRPEIDQGQLAENIPRTMQVGKSEVVEVRIARGAARALADGMQGSGQAYLRDLVVTKAMSVRLRSLDRGFAIDPASPETQWIENTTGLGDDFASWRWNVTPLRSGGGRLQLLVSARTIASDGLSADTALPDQVFEIKVKADYARSIRRSPAGSG